MCAVGFSGLSGGRRTAGPGAQGGATGRNRARRGAENPASGLRTGAEVPASTGSRSDAAPVRADTRPGLEHPLARFEFPQPANEPRKVPVARNRIAARTRHAHHPRYPIDPLDAPARTALPRQRLESAHREQRRIATRTGVRTRAPTRRPNGARTPPPHATSPAPGSRPGPDPEPPPTTPPTPRRAARPTPAPNDEVRSGRSSGC